MKKTKIALLAILGLSMLAGCRAKTSSSVASSSEAPISQVAPTSSSTPASSTPVSSKEEASSSTPASSSVKKQTSDWSKELEEEMIKDLNCVLPYVNLGKSYEFEWTIPSYYDDELPYLNVIGSDDFDDTKYSEYKKAYEDAGWTVVYDEEEDTLTCTKEGTNITVVFSEDEDSECTMFNAYYDEPFDATGHTAWDEDTLDAMNSALHNHEVPYVYLGTSSPYVSSWGGCEIFGGKWEDSIITSAKAAFEAAGWTVTEETADAYSEFKKGTTYIEATKTFDDGCVLTVELGYYSYYTKPVMDISITEPFDPSLYTAYSQDIIDEIDDNLDNHSSIIPVIYLGTFNPTAGYSTYSKYFYMYGTYDTWDDAIITNAKAVLEAAGWTVTATTSELTATYETEDGCLLEMTIENDYGEPYMTITHSDKWDPTSVFDWTNDLKEDLKDTFGDTHTVPFVYLGTKTAETSSSSSGSTYIIDGGRWKDDVLTLSKTTLTADGWTCTDYKDSYSDGVQAVKDFGDGYYMILKIYSSYSGIIRMSVTLHETWDDTKTSAWDDDTQEYIESLVGEGHDIPYVYMGVSVNDVADYYDAVYGELYDARMFDEVKKAFQGQEGWTVTETTLDSSDYTLASGSVIVCTKTFDDGYIVTLTFGKEYDYYDEDARCAMEIEISEVYDPTKMTKWSDEALDAFEENMGGHEEDIPVVYLGTRDPEIYTSSYSADRVTVYIGTWNDQLPTDVKAVFDKAGGWTWTESTEENWYGEEYTEYTIVKTYENGDTITVTFSEYAGSMIFQFKSGFTVDTSITDWSDGMKKLMNNFLDNHAIPYFYLNSDMDSLEDSWYESSYSNSATIYGGTWYDDMAELAEAAFEADGGWTETKDTSYYGTSYSFTKTFDDDHIITVTLGPSYSGSYMSMTLKKAFKVDTSITDWNDKINKLFSDNICSDFKLPYFYIGALADLSAQYEDDYSELEIQGGDWDDQIWDLAHTAFENAGGWTESTTYVLDDDGEPTTEIDERIYKKSYNGKVYTVILQEDYYGYAYMNIYSRNEYVVDTTVTDWDDTMKAAFTKYMNGKTIPFFYTGNSWDEIYGYNYAGEYDCYCYSKTDYGSGVIDEAKKAFAADNADGIDWTVTETTANDEPAVKFTKTFSDGSKMSVYVCCGYSGEIYISVEVDDAPSSTNP